MKKTLLLTFFLLFASCSSDKTVTPASDDTRNFFQLSENTGYSLNELVSESNGILEKIAKRHLLSSATDEDKENLTQSFKRINKSLNDIAKETNIISAIKVLRYSIEIYENALILKRDKLILENFFSKIMYLTAIYAKRYNVDIKEMKGSSIIDHTFMRDSLGLFTTAELTLTSPKWESGAGGGNSFAVIQANGTESESWLLSPKYDLKAKLPKTLSISHIVKDLNSYEKISMLISTNYNGGNPNNADWDSYSLSDSQQIPPNTWYTVNTPEINVEKYAGKQIVIAFKFSSDIGDNFIWEILNFKISGIGQKALEFTYKNDFSLLNIIEEYPLNDLSKVTQELLTGNTPVRFKYSRSNDLFYASGYKQNFSGSIILYSEEIDLSSISNPYVQIVF